MDARPHDGHFIGQSGYKGHRAKCGMEKGSDNKETAKPFTTGTDATKGTSWELG